MVIQPLSTSLKKPYFCFTLPPTQHHSFFRNYKFVRLKKLSEEWRFLHARSLSQQHVIKWIPLHSRKPKGELKAESQLFFCGLLFSKYHLRVIKNQERSSFFRKDLEFARNSLFFQFERPPFCVLFFSVTSKKRIRMPPATCTFWRYCTQPIDRF